MAVGKIERFNRIIKIWLYPKIGIPVTINCPIHGRKPSIEISGNILPKGTLPAFNLTLKNLYLDLKGEQYAKVRVEAGYYGNTVTLEGTILSIYQEMPGPEGRTVIQCNMGQMSAWLDGLVNLNYDAGTPLVKVLAEIGKTVSTYGIQTGKMAGKLTLSDRFEFNGTARDAIAQLEKRFINKRLSIFIRDNRLCAICMAKNDAIQTHTLQYISAPPQPNAGGEDGTYYITLTAPWEPKLQIGDLLRVPSKIYMKNYTSVGTKNKGTQVIQVTTLSFHFGTTGGTNSMQVQGFLVGDLS